jgi:hypothetical protein
MTSKPYHIREPEVEKDDLRPFSARQGHRLAPARGFDDAVAMGSQTRPQKAANLRFVIDDQHTDGSVTRHLPISHVWWLFFDGKRHGEDRPLARAATCRDDPPTMSLDDASANRQP